MKNIENCTSNIAIFFKNMGVNHPTLNIPNMKNILPPEHKNWITEAQNLLFESKIHIRRPKL